MLEILDRLDRLEARIAKSLPVGRTSSDSSKLERFAARYREDYLGFTKLLDVVHKEGGGRVPFELNDIQAAYNAARTPRDVCLKARQVGMTTEALARDLWHFLTHEGALVVIVCQSITGHDAQIEVARKLTVFFDALERRGLGLRFAKRTQSEWVLADRDASLRIVEAGASQAAASKKGRAGTITRLHLTEVAFWEFGGETVNALLECVPGPESGSEIQYESTANGAAGEERGSPKEASGAAIFHWAVQDAQRGKTGFRFHFFEWFRERGYSVPLADGEIVEPRTARERQLVALGITLEQLKWYQRKLGEKYGAQDLIDQEYPSDPDTCFLLTGRGFFDGPRIGEQLGRAREPTETVDIRQSGAHGQIVGGREIPALRIFHTIEAGKRYVLSLDPAEGDGGDAAAGIVLEYGTARHMATLWGQFKPWELARAAVGVAQRYGGALVVVERNNHGHACLRALDAEQHYRGIFKDLDDKPGWLNVEAKRTEALDRFEQAHRAGHFDTADRFLLSEMRTFIITKSGKAEAAKGANDDLVMAAAIGIDVISRPVKVTRYGFTSLDPV